MEIFNYCYAILSKVRYSKYLFNHYSSPSHRTKEIAANHQTFDSLPQSFLSPNEAFKIPQN